MRAELAPTTLDRSAPSASAPSATVAAQVGATLFAKGALTVVAEPTQGAMQIGLLELGDEAALDGEPAAGSGCPAGWAKLAAGGFVCTAKDTTRDASDPLIALVRAEGRAAPGSPYPYSYGESRGAPTYVRAPTADEQARSEPSLDAERAVLATARRAAMLGKDDEIPPHLRGVELTAPADPCPPALLAKRDGEPPLARASTVPARAGVAWIAECEAEGRTWLVTPERTVLPRERVARSFASAVHGVARPGSDKIAFVTGKARPRYRMVRYGFFEVMEPALPVFSIVRLTGQTHAVGPATYLETADGGAYVLADHVAIVEPLARPSGVGAAEKWVDLDARRGLLVAYEGDAIAYAALVAAPAVSTDEAPGRVRRGRYRVEWKHRSRTFGEGAGLRAHLPHVLVLSGGSAIVGDPWQPLLGTSSGQSARLAPADAAWLFAWATPAVPDGWSSRRGTEAAPGTWVFVR